MKNKILKHMINVLYEINTQKEKGEYRMANGMASVLRLTEIEAEELKKDSYQEGIDFLLQLDKKRFGDSYEYPKERFSKDVNNGHWDLWVDEGDNKNFPQEFDLGGDYYAYDPSEDIQNESIVAIDFGTSATVVVASSDRDERRPLSIDASVDANNKAKRYENPTIMKLVDLDTFLKMYKEREGRPFTKWEHINVANEASSSFKEASSADYYAYIHQLKQWAGDNNKRIRFKTTKGEDIYLKPYVDIEAGIFDIEAGNIDPIEIYAYYIGLNINRLRTNKIYLKYYLSFPTTFKQNIKKKITESFERGLEKSLPLSVLRNKTKMAQFSVCPDVSEPLAYASCVLKAYGIRPKPDDTVNYAIFDFGGGTTDCNFGKWSRYTDSISYSYKIKTLGDFGLNKLGGENLLEGLAHKIFKDNIDFMRENNFFFQDGPFSNESGYKEGIDNKSQFAASNMKQLMEALRPCWEKSYYYNYRIIRDLIKTPSMNLDNESLMGLVRSEIDFYEEVKAKDPNSKDIIENLKKLYDDCLADSDAQDNKLRLIDILKDESEYSGDSYSKKIILKIRLADDHGKTFEGKELNTTTDVIFSFLEEKIQEGITSFFSAMENISDFYKEDKNKICVFLAGNSCKSPITTSLFKKAINERLNGKVEFDLFYPLGSIEAEKRMKDDEIEPEYEIGEGPNGKTGVAFGLIDCSKEQGRVFIEEGSYITQFKYYLGWDDDRYFTPYTFIEVGNPNNKVIGNPEIGKWYRVDKAKADRATLTIYAMANPKCKDGNIKIKDNVEKLIRLELAEQNKEKCIFLKVSGPDEIHYDIAEEGVDKSKLKGTEIDLTKIGV